VKHQRRSIFILLVVALFVIASPALAQQTSTEIEDITDEVAQVRELEPLLPIEVETMTREELREYNIQAYAEEYPESEQYADERELLAFGLMNEHIDIGDLAIDLFSEQVLGFYDPETGQMVVVRDAGQEGSFTPTEQVTYAHEIVHALQDQHFDLDAGPLDREPLSDDQHYAVSALIEGDASYSELQYLLEHPDLLEAYVGELEAVEFDTAALDAAPPIISATLIFPYDQGYTFIEAIHQQGGWEAIDAAYADPPASTEQILHPEKYLAGEQPVEVAVPDFSPALGDDWTVFDTNTFGEFQIRVMFQETALSDEQAALAAAGWGGDTYVVAGTDDDSVNAIHWRTVWDTEQDAVEFARAWTLRESERWGVDPNYVSGNLIEFETDGAVVRIILEGNTVTYLMAPTFEMIETIQSVPPATPSASPVATPVS
jgi:hypothetical protein